MRHLVPCNASYTGVQKLLVVMELQLLHNDPASFLSGHSISFPYFFFLRTIPYFSCCPEVHVCVIEGSHVSWKVVRPLREKQCPESPGDWPASQPTSCPRRISVERTISHQTSQWRERSPLSRCHRKKGKWKLMNRIQVTAVQRQCETDQSKTGRRGEAEGSESAATQTATDITVAQFLKQPWYFCTFLSGARKSESNALVSLICSFLYFFI